ncbi:alpha-(1,3)-fucosyltransferase 10 isoform X1 [Hydra vulgaris]|uniref:Fucosyltransferase n=2 Tax=Hydra vulgaris TaxID=6087 RepID=T2MB85_HYDVU|nr:alpha-(1,3)-fucosyltransferase 10 isoform X1 [Hydra vulgaris]
MKVILSTRLKNIFLIIITLSAIVYLYLQWSFQSQLSLFESDDLKSNYIKDIGFTVEEEYDVDGQVADSEKTDDKFTELEDGIYHNFEVDRVISPVFEARQYADKNNLPFILWWTPFTGEKGKLKKCFIGECYFTIDRQLYNHNATMALLFYGSNFNGNDLPLPRKKLHEWGLLHEESPKNQALFMFQDIMELFNYTSTFKQQSSYPISTQYIVSESYLLKPSVYTVSEKNWMKETLDLASIAYIQTGCNPPSDRDAYVQELMKYIRVDSYGKCLHNKDLPVELNSPSKMNSKAFIEFIGKYKFVLSFENAICNDYITEKLFRTFNMGSIPIYKGAPNIRDWLPDDHSAIIVDDFNSPKDLADYINFVDSNSTVYEQYLEYKTIGLRNPILNKALSERQWGVKSFYRMSYVTGFECYVCDQIHSNLKLMQEGKLPIKHQATFEHYGCPKPEKYNYSDIPGAFDWERNIWLWEYEKAKKNSVLLKEKVYSTLE